MLLGIAMDDATPAGKNVSVLLGEAAFIARPYAQGERVRLGWTDADARTLVA